MKRDSFIIYRSFYEPIKRLSMEEKGFLFDAICNYALDEITPDDLSPMLLMAFNFIGSTIDLNSKKYQNVVERNRENGKKGGRPNKEPKKPSGLTGNPNNPEEPQKADNDNGNDNDNGKRKTKVFVPPTLTEFQKYFAENGYSQETAKRAFQGYEVTDWIDSSGKHIRSWKQKCQHVWFKPENSHVGKTLNTQQESKEKTFKAI